MSLMSSRKIGSRMGSVNPESSSQNFRFPSSTVSRPETTPISSPSFAGFPYHKDAEEERSVDEDGFRGGNLGYEDMLARLEEVKDSYVEAFPNEKDLGGNIRIREPGSANNHPYFSSSPTIPLESRAQSSDNGIGNHGNRESFPSPQTMIYPRIHTSSQAQDYLTGMDPALDRFRAGERVIVSDQKCHGT